MNEANSVTENAVPHRTAGNLRPFAKGDDPRRNKGGRPSWLPLTRALQAELGKIAPAEMSNRLKLRKGSTWAECIARRLVIAASCGDVSAAATIFNRTEGLPQQNLAITNEQAAEIQIRVHYDDPPGCIEGEEDRHASGTARAQSSLARLTFGPGGKQ